MDHLCVLTLLAPVLLEEELVDALLETDFALEFTAGSVYAHASNDEVLSLVEQVTGRRRKIRFEIMVTETHLSALLESLGERLKGSGVHYTVRRVETAGRF